MTTFNQNEYGIWPDCTLTTCSQIMRNKYWIDFQYKTLDQILWQALLDKVILEEWGANFEIFYEWYVNTINKESGLKFKIRKNELTSSVFEYNLDHNGFYWLWLKLWNSAYLNAARRWEITKEDIDKIAEQWGGFMHNNCYWKDFIDEIYIWERVKAPLEVLLYWVEKWVFWTIGRDIVPANQETEDVCRLLIIWRTNKHYDPVLDWKTTAYDKQIMNKAGDILLKYEFKTDDWSKRIYLN